MKNIKCITFLSCLFISFSNLIIAQNLIVVNENNKAINIAKQVSFLEDKESIFTIKDILQEKLQNKFVSNNQAIPFFGFTHSSYWIKFNILTTTSKPLALEIKNNLLDSVFLFILEEGQVVYQSKAGLFIPFKERNVSTNYFLFDIPLNINEKHIIYLRAKSSLPLQIPLVVGQKDVLLENNANNKLIQGIYFGFVLLMIFYNLFIYFIVKDKDYLLYVFNCFFVGLSMLIFHSFLYELVFFDYYYLNKYFDTINSFSVSIAFNFIYILRFLRVKQYSKLFYYTCFLLIFSSCIVIFLNLLSFKHESFVINQFVSSASTLIATIIPIYIYYRGYKPARFFLVAWIGFILGGIVEILKSSTLLPANAFTNNAYQIGTAIQMLLFSLALADKINIYKKKQEETQKENLRLVEEQKETLEAKVKERTNELESANAEILTQNEELQQQQEELTVTNETLETTFKQLKNTSDRLNKSIQYAYNIQQVILPKKDKLNSFFQSHFSLYLPKDVVSGDFYWFTILNEDMAIFALADCTGHGVPGAFMSMIGNTLLHEITKTKNIYNPAEILLNLHHGIRSVLKQDEGQNSDGMDISICLFEKQKSLDTYKVTFAGAKTNLFYQKEEQIYYLEGNRINVGGFTERKREFTNQIITLPKGSIIYFTSDGYIDQHNTARKRFGTTKFKELLQQIYQQDIHNQEKIILKTLKEHQKEEEQRDDISVVGIKL